MTRVKRRVLHELEDGETRAGDYMRENIISSRDQLLSKTIYLLVRTRRVRGPFMGRRVEFGRRTARCAGIL